LRIATLLPSATEIACHVGLRDQLVAVSHECDYPSGLEDLPAITQSVVPHGLSQGEIDRVVREAVAAGNPLYTVVGEVLEATRPELVITQGICDVCAVNEGTVQAALAQVVAAEFPETRVLSLSGMTWEGVLRDIARVADAASVPQQGRAAVADLRERWQAAQAPSPQPVPMMILEWTEPPFTCGHWVPEQVAAAGGREVMIQAGARSQTTTWAAIAAADPDVLVVATCGQGLDDNVALARELLTHPEASQLRALKTGQIWAVDANAQFSRPAPRLLDGVETLAAILAGRPTPHAVHVTR
jgi:iron complex transport system substrate-binding protein